MQHFYNNQLRLPKNGGTTYQSVLAQLMQTSRTEIKRVGWGSWG